MISNSTILRGTLLALCLLLTPAAQALTITHVAQDMADVNPGEDLWRYTYQVSGHTFTAGEGFSIFFDPTLFGALSNPTGNADWDILTLQPDPILPGDGLFDALALVNGASLADPFSVDVVWLGQGAPGGQAFVLYDETFATIGSGISVSGGTVPEPATALLMLAGLGALSRARRGSTN